MSEKTSEFIIENGIVTICRKLYGEDLLNLAKALYEGGIKLIEVTFDQSDADCIKKTSDAIAMLVANLGDKMLFGAGTVLTLDQVKAAADAGATYIISPNVDPAIIRYTKELGLTSIPGAMTPTEIVNAHQYGADIVKVFPAGYLGIKYVKDIKGPISHIPLLAAGGINEENIGEFFSSGYLGFGVSGRLTEGKLIKEKNFQEFTERAKAFVKALKEA
ncbi:MAG: 2-dehydro-3-deoxyphosphogluconate aldolase [Clostridiales bacterium 38-18]|mgnify:CR=1 FL=1|nr:MAG: 2-dehydro-3-deoxyphosphogluconate aldolase [Clostridiales bacterium 38-18]